jgi:hypothetical protein
MAVTIFSKLPAGARSSGIFRPGDLLFAEPVLDAFADIVLKDYILNFKFLINFEKQSRF